MPDHAGDEHEHRHAMYDGFADAFETHARDSPYNAQYDRPALLDLVGDVRGLDVLDAGCGPGYYAEELVAGGARVVGIDGSARLLELARGRLGDGADLRLADLEAPLDLADASFDVVVLALVLHHVERRVAMLRELRRVLRPHGRIVVSTVHPTADWLRLGGSYFDVEEVRERWNDGWDVRFLRQPLGAWTDEFRDAGLLIERVVEPLPAAAMRESHPDVHERLSREPGFIAFVLVPDPARQ